MLAHGGFRQIGYAGDHDGDFPLYECHACGTAVSATTTHRRWHARRGDKIDDGIPG